jgi:hypothetical protein
MNKPSCGITETGCSSRYSGDMEDHMPACHLLFAAGRMDNKGVLGLGFIEIGFLLLVFRSEYRISTIYNGRKTHFIVSGVTYI